MWATKLLISPVKKGFFAQKRPNLAPNWHFWSIWARPCRLIWCPAGGWVGCGARAVSRKTPFTLFQTRICAYLKSNNQCIKRFHQRTRLCYAGQHIIYFQPLVGLCSLSPEPESDRAEHELANCSHVFVICCFSF